MQDIQVVLEEKREHMEKDTKGLYRVHQFTKIEQVVICKADYDEQYKLH